MGGALVSGDDPAHEVVADHIHILEPHVADPLDTVQHTHRLHEAGFLARRKVDPYLRPIYDALYDFMEARHVDRGLQTGIIEIAPLAFMRGRTLTNAVVLLDEAQNTTSMQMKMFLTRLGENSRMIITGDPSQIDLPPGQKSGLVEAVNVLDGVEGIGRVRFRDVDVVRHDLVRRIVTAYESASHGEAEADRNPNPRRRPLA